MYYDLGFNHRVFEIDKTIEKQIADSFRDVWKNHGDSKNKLKISMDNVASIYKSATSNVIEKLKKRLGF